MADVMRKTIRFTEVDQERLDKITEFINQHELTAPSDQLDEKTEDQVTKKIRATLKLAEKLIENHDMDKRDTAKDIKWFRERYENIVKKADLKG